MAEWIGYALLDANSAIDDGCLLHIGKEDNSNDDDHCQF